MIGATLIELVLMLMVPLALARVLIPRLGTSWRVLRWGAATFVASQALRWPVLSGLTAMFIANPAWAPAQAWLFAFNTSVLALTAGAFEECARYVGYKVAIPDARRWSEGVTYGLGHGVAEAIILGLLVATTFGTMLVLRDPALTAALHLTPVTDTAVATQLKEYWSTPWFVAILGGLERLNAICVHLCLAVIVLRAVTSGKKSWLLLAVALHAAFDFVAVWTLTRVGVVAAEMVIAAGATLALLVLLRMRPQGEAGLTK